MVRGVKHEACKMLENKSTGNLLEKSRYSASTTSAIQYINQVKKYLQIHIISLSTL